MLFFTATCDRRNTGVKASPSAGSPKRSPDFAQSHRLPAHPGVVSPSRGQLWTRDCLQRCCWVSG